MKSKWPAVLLTCILFSGNAIAQQRLPSAESLLKKACKQAAPVKKNIFVIFHASWCGPCKTIANSIQLILAKLIKGISKNLSYEAMF